MTSSKNKKLILIILFIIVLLPLSIGMVLHFYLVSLEDAQITKPPIVDHFACGDYCPGDSNKYMVKVYQGVNEEDVCRKLGGSPSNYIGLGTTYICIAEESNVYRVIHYLKWKLISPN